MGTQSCMLKICDNSRVELTGRPCKDLVKAKKTAVSIACITVSREGVRSWAFMECHFSRRGVLQQWICALRNTGNSTCLLSGKKRLVVGKESYISWNSGFEQLLQKYWCCITIAVYLLYLANSLPQRNKGL